MSSRPMGYPLIDASACPHTPETSSRDAGRPPHGRHRGAHWSYRRNVFARHVGMTVAASAKMPDGPRDAEQATSLPRRCGRALARLLPRHLRVRVRRTTTSLIFCICSAPVCSSWLSASCCGGGVAGGCCRREPSPHRSRASPALIGGPPLVEVPGARSRRAPLP